MLDVAARVGSGVGSYGVERFYVLLAGDQAKELGHNSSQHNSSQHDSSQHDSVNHFLGSVILDVKFEPRPAVSSAGGPPATLRARGCSPYVPRLQLHVCR